MNMPRRWAKYVKLKIKLLLKNLKNKTSLKGPELTYYKRLLKYKNGSHSFNREDGWKVLTTRKPIVSVRTLPNDTRHNS